MRNLRRLIFVSSREATKPTVLNWSLELFMTKVRVVWSLVSGVKLSLFSLQLTQSRKDGMCEPTKGYVSQTLKAHWENRDHEKCRRHFNGNQFWKWKSIAKINRTVGEGKVSQVQRLVNRVHFMAKHNISNADCQWEPIFSLLNLSNSFSLVWAQNFSNRSSKCFFSFSGDGKQT